MENDIVKNLFSTFETDDEGGNGGAQINDQGGGNMEFNVEGQTDDQTQEHGEGDAGKGGDDKTGNDETVTIKKSDWDNTQQMLAEFRGYMTAEKARKSDPEPPRVIETPPVQQIDPRQQQAAFDGVFQKIGEKMIENPAEGAKALFALAAQYNAQQSAQAAAPALTSAVDLMIENFVTRKQSKDPLYDKGVGEKFEERLKKIDPRVAAGASRAQINEALETLYQSAKGEWADEAYAQAQKNKKATPKQEPTNYGGGKSAGTHQVARTTVPETWKKFALDAGIPEADLTPEFFQVKE